MEKPWEMIIPDIIISDVMMPKWMAGTVPFPQGRGAYSHIPIILLTARLLQEDRLKGLPGRGADAYLAKPFDPARTGGARLQLMELRWQLRDKVPACRAD